MWLSWQHWGQYVALQKNNQERDMNHTPNNISIKMHIHSEFEKALKNQSSSSSNLMIIEQKNAGLHTHTHTQIYESSQDHWNS